ncbi:MAG: DUF4369 domain-containing protein, partial [Bacteroidales bacterium]|nr:DUF4369 domain-containing protein [Bacteroidales bacterium]
MFTWQFCIATIVTACKENSHTFTLNAQIEHFDNQIVRWYQLTNNNNLLIDSVQTDGEGKFVLNGSATQPIITELVLGNNQSVFLVPDKNEKIELHADLNTLHINYHVSGSPESELVRQLIVEQNTMFGQLSDLFKNYQDSLSGHNAHAEQLIERRNNGQETNCGGLQRF